MSELPSAIICDILSRLEVKPLLRFRCVCKSWRSLLSDPYFVKLHLNRASEGGNPDLFFISNNKFYSLKSYDETTATEIDLSFIKGLRPTSISVVGSCNGLVCLSDHTYLGKIYVLNPATREYKKLPIAPSGFQGLKSGVCIVGFGHNPVTDDYKVVILYNLSLSGVCPVLNVYSLSTDSWTIVGDLSLIIKDKFQALVNGALHWRGATSSLSYHSNSIVSFDFVDEVFRDLPPPDFGDVSESKSWSWSLGVLGGCLCILRLFGQSYEMWVMEDYGLKQSWTKRFSLSYFTMFVYHEVIRPLSFWSNGKILVESSMDNFRRYRFVHDLGKGRGGVLGDYCFKHLLRVKWCVGTLASLVSLSANSGLQAEGKRSKMEKGKQSANSGLQAKGKRRKMEKGKHRSERIKVITRDLSHRPDTHFESNHLFTHHIFKRAAHPEKHEPDKMHMFRVTHTKRDGSFVDAASADRMAQMELCLSQLPEVSDSSSARNVAFTQVMGADGHGRIRTYGTGVTPTTFRAAAAAVETDRWRRAATDAEASTTAVTSQLTTEMDALKKQLATMQQYMESMGRHMMMPPPTYTWEDTDATQPPDDTRP